MKKNRLILFFLLFLSSQVIFSNSITTASIQNLQVQNINDSLLIISYDIVKAKKGQIFDVRLEAKFQAGKNIDIQSISGAIGTTTSSLSKTIKWDISKDIYEFNGFLKLTLRAESFSGNVISSNSKLVHVHIEKQFVEIENIDPTNESLADIHWILPEKRSLTVSEKRFSIHACVSSKIKISKIDILINNQLIISDRGFKPILNNCPNTIKKDFDLVEGLNEVRLKIIDEKGQETESFLLIQKK